MVKLVDSFRNQKNVLQEEDLKNVMEELLLNDEFERFSWELDSENMSNAVRERIRSRVEKFWYLLPQRGERKMKQMVGELENVKEKKSGESDVSKRELLQREQNRLNAAKSKWRKYLKSWENPQISDSKQLGELATPVTLAKEVLGQMGVNGQTQQLVARFRALCSLTLDPKYITNLVQNSPNNIDEKWNFNTVTRGAGLKELVRGSQFEGGAPDQLQTLFRFVRPQLEMTDEEFSNFLLQQHRETMPYTDYELWSYFAEFIRDRAVSETPWTWSDVRRVVTNDQVEIKKEETGEVSQRKRSAGESIGTSISKHLITPMKSRTASSLKSGFSEMGIRISSQKINTAMRFFDDGGHQKTAGTKIEKNEMEAAISMANFLDELVRDTGRKWKGGDVRTLDSGEYHLYSPLFSNVKNRQMVLANVKEFLEKYDHWDSSYTLLFTSHRFLLGRSEIGKDAQEELYFEQRKKGLKSLIDKFSHPGNQQYFSAATFRSEKVECADFWRVEFGGSLTRLEFLEKLKYWTGEFSIPFGKKQEKIMDWYLAARSMRVVQRAALKLFFQESGDGLFFLKDILSLDGMCVAEVKKIETRDDFLEFIKKIFNGHELPENIKSIASNFRKKSRGEGMLTVSHTVNSFVRKKADEKLVIQAVEALASGVGKSHQISLLYEKMKSPIRYWCHGILMSANSNTYIKEDVEDMFHDVFNRAVGGIQKSGFSFSTDSQEGRANLIYGYFKRVTVNTSINFYRKSSQKKVVSLGGDDELKEIVSHHQRVTPSGGIDKKREIGETSDFLMKYLMDAGVEEFFVEAVLMYANDYKYKEIAEHQGVQEGTVKSRIFLGRAEIKKVFKKRGMNSVEDALGELDFLG